MSDTDDLISTALWLAGKGIRVFPLIPELKRPLLTGWQLNASDDAQTVLNWFALKHPGANLGVAADSMIVLDMDVHSREKWGPDTLSALESEHGALPATFTVKTASGGVHFYYSNPTGVPVTKGADKVGPGLDIQTGNAYLVGPHSTTRDDPKERTVEGVYSIIDSSDIAPCPGWLLDLIKDKPAAPVKIRRATTPDAPVNNKYVQSAIDGELNRLSDCGRSGWAGAPWDQTTYEVACNLIEISNTPEAGYSAAQAYSDFMATAPTDEKFGPRQHEAKWRSAVRKVGGATRVFPVVTSRTNVRPEPVAGAEEKSNTTPPNATGELVILPPAPPSKPPAKHSPGEFFEKGHGLLVEQLAHAVKHDFGIGPDGELWLYEGGIFRPAPRELMTRVTQILRDSYRPGHYSAVKDFVSSLPELMQLTTEQPDPRYIILQNGVYDWAENVLRPHSPEYGAITQLPIEIDGSSDCPEFDLYLSEVIPEDTIELVWEMIGYMMMFGNPFQRSIIFQGPGGNGKSTMLRVLQAMLGKGNVSALSLRQMSEDRFAVAGLLGKTANLAGDIDSKYLGDASRFKQIVGGDLIEVERKYGQPFTFSPYVVPVFSANEFWKTGDTTEGYWRRWLTIPFPYKVTGPGKRHLDESLLMAEIPAIFTKAMVGLRNLMARGDWAEVESVMALRKEMKDSADILSDWFSEDESIIAYDPADDTMRTTRTEAYAAFKRWCTISGHKGMASTNFYKRLSQLGFGEAKIKGTRYLYGIEIATYHQPQLNL